MNIILSVPAVCMIIGIVFGVINNELRNSTFWFWLAGLFGLGILLGR